MVLFLRARIRATGSLGDSLTCHVALPTAITWRQTPRVQSGSDLVRLSATAFERLHRCVHDRITANAAALSGFNAR